METVWKIKQLRPLNIIIINVISVFNLMTVFLPLCSALCCLCLEKVNPASSAASPWASTSWAACWCWSEQSTSQVSVPWMVWIIFQMLFLVSVLNNKQIKKLAVSTESVSIAATCIMNFNIYQEIGSLNVTIRCVHTNHIPLTPRSVTLYAPWSKWNLAVFVVSKDTPRIKPLDPLKQK